jgi:hypothetical protein
MHKRIVTFDPRSRNDLDSYRSPASVAISSEVYGEENADKDNTSTDAFQPLMPNVEMMHVTALCHSRDDPRTCRISASLVPMILVFS